MQCLSVCHSDRHCWALCIHKQSVLGPVSDRIGNASSSCQQRPDLTQLTVAAGAAPLPAFGMAVFKSAPTSRSPSAENSRPASAAQAPTDVAAATTAAPEAPAAAPGPATAVSEPSAAAAPDMQPATAAEDADADSLQIAATAAHGVQASGSKRKRGADATQEEQQVQASAGKQARVDVAAAHAGAPHETTASALQHCFDPIKSHK